MGSVLLVVGLSIVNISVIYLLTNKVIRAIEEAATIDRCRVVYEDEQIGTLTAYKSDAILELLDGTVVVLPRQDEADEHTASQYDDNQARPRKNGRAWYKWS